MPTLKEIEEVWLLPNAPGPLPENATADQIAAHAQATAQYARKKAVLVWYVDEYLEKAAGLEFWGPSIRPFRLLTDKAHVPGDPSGKKKVLVTVTSEAFGLTVYANCRDKWMADFALKKKNKKAKIPKYDKNNPSTYNHKNKWTCSMTGQVAGGGWHTDAMDYLTNAQISIQKWREKEAAAGNPTLKLARNWIKEEAEIGVEISEPAAKKRKKDDGKKAESKAIAINLVIIDE